MAYASESLASCALNYQISAILTEMINVGKKIDDISSALNTIFGFEGKFTTDVFEKYAVEDDFSVGDAFIFNKNVWHRSSPLRKGSLTKRLAVNMRFVDWRSRLDMDRFHGEANTGGGLGLGVDFGTQKQTNYGSHFEDIKNGDELRDSIYCGDIL